RFRRAGRPPARGGSAAPAAVRRRYARMSRAAVLAVDGGNSKTDLALVAPDGSLLALVRGPLSSPQHLGVDGCIDALDRLLTEAIGEHDGKVADIATLLLAGAGFPAAEQAVREADEARVWHTSVNVHNVTF